MPRRRLMTLLPALALLTGGSALNVEPRLEAAETGIDLAPLLKVRLPNPLGQLRVVPVRLGEGRPRAILAVHATDAEDDPYVEMFFFPRDTLRLTLFTEEGEILWTRDLGGGVVPGIWFCPVFPFDLDGDGVDEIYLVGNPDADHPLGLSHYRLERLDATTGRTVDHWPWPPVPSGQSNSHRFRNFILGGTAGGRPVLVTAQGTYGRMALQGYGPGMTPLWEHEIAADAPGARGSHMTPVVDLDGDGDDEVFWGERAISLATGEELFCADRDTWSGHSDVIAPLRVGERWLFHTTRESGDGFPRVAVYDTTGQRVWGDVDTGHMDMGWAARLGPAGETLVMAIRIGSKTAGPDGFFRKSVEEFVYDASTGKAVTLPLSVFCTLPVDLDGDGIHELVRGLAEGDGAVLDREGSELGNVGGQVAAASKLLDHPGEQIVAWSSDGTIRVWGDRRAADRPRGRARYADPCYSANQRLTATGYNLVNLGGL